uniref:Zinc finger CCCH-type containing 3 n=1 Tax=Molossus molossus TaxID=27622 RepID=A0A7J8BBD3_MOLMO|nr:zinc finger CCCH-type containing 3 [Molossus molossus]
MRALGWGPDPVGLASVRREDTEEGPVSTLRGASVCQAGRRPRGSRHLPLDFQPPGLRGASSAVGHPVSEPLSTVGSVRCVRSSGPLSGRSRSGPWC